MLLSIFVKRCFKFDLSVIQHHVMVLMITPFGRLNKHILSPFRNFMAILHSFNRFTVGSWSLFSKELTIAVFFILGI